MSSIGDAVTYPMESDDWLKTILIGGILLPVTLSIIPSGYLVRAIRANLDGKPEPPSFGDWGELFVDGLKLLIVYFIYMLIPLVVMIFTVGTAVAALVSGGEAGAAAGMGTIAVGLLVTIVLSLVFGYFAVVGVVNMAKEDQFGAAFDVGTIKSVGLNSDFAVPWLISVGVFFGINVITNLLNVIPGLGFILWFFLQFYGLVVASTLWADGFLAATDGGTAGRTGVEETPA